MSPSIPQEIIDLIIDQVAFANTDYEMRDAQARMDLAASQMGACGLDIMIFLPLLRCISFLGGPPMPLSIAHENIDEAIIDEVDSMDTNWDVRDPQARRNLHASGRLRRACGLGIYNTQYLSSCALVARSWLWSSRSHQFRTLRFVYPRRRQQLKGLLGLIHSPLCTINDHVFEIDIVSTLLASDMVALASLSNLQSIWLQGSPSLDPPDAAAWQDGLPTLLESFAHLTTLAISFVRFTSLSQFAAVVAACQNLETLSIKNVGLLLDSPAHSFLPRHFSPPALRSLRIAQHRVRGCNAVYDCLSLLRNAGPSLEHLAINANRNSRDFDLHEPPLPDLDHYPGLQSFAWSWSTDVFNKDTQMQAAEICTAIGQISSLCMRTIEITIDMDDPEDIEQLALQPIDLYLQRPNFASLQWLTFFTIFSEPEIMRDWARESFPA
ncbi:hypothetical protein FIBSPDRAFT_865265 [Athelia psychrophila]|uniref:F-box domain-containing protein n=1 Tax=Athelia psychrophila TaxID=1759441 RepID=A0A166FSI1_9AGAM|nr:hypothetical protein FIBSPDRAFT_865265 [Fibularhizoctonia sp. CBS 109695]